MNSLHVGFARDITLPSGGSLFIHDELPAHPLAKIFDPTIHSLNPLKDITPKRAQELTDVLYTVFPQGENTLTVRNGQMDMAPALLTAERFDKLKTDSDEVRRLIDNLLFLPVVRNVLCGRKHLYRFRPEKIVAARLNRAEIGDRAALIIGLVLMNTYKGQIVVPDFGFYGREAHISLIREHRLIAGINFLDELPPKLRRALLLIKEKKPRGALLQDAETLAEYAGKARGTNGFADYVSAAVA